MYRYYDHQYHDVANNKILSSLTNKQKEAILLANKLGYYNYPRRVSISQLSKIMGISKTTTIEHLRRAEKTIMGLVLNGN